MFRKGLDLNPVRGREQAGLRPVLVISHDIFNKSSGTVIALQLPPTTEGWLSPVIPHENHPVAKTILGENQPDTNPFN